MVAMVMSAPVSTCWAMMRAEIHAIELVAAEDEQVFEIVVQEMDEVFADGVGGALIPGGVGEGLFGREDFDEAAGEMIELVGLRNVAVERGGIELGQQVDALQSPELMQLEMGISTRRYLPASGTAGLARSLVSGKSRVPCPPPMMTERTRLNAMGS